jgi:FKBP-type peptidyl-prolyl cis-trans isomerase
MRRTLLAIALALPIVAGDAPAMPTPPAPTAEEAAQLRSQASYLVGLRVKQMIDQAVKQGELDQAEILRGLNEAIAGKAAEVDPAKANDIFQRYDQTVQAKKAKEGEGRKGENAAFLAENAKKPGMMSTASGLQYEILSAGKADGKQPTGTSKVKVNYEGKLRNGEVFDASAKHGGPASFGLDGVIKGWTEGLQLMREGAKFRFTIPSELAYGENGPPGIGANQVLIFEVELLEVLSSPK